MKIQIKSDLHTEFNGGNHDPKHPKHYIHPDAKVIVLAGDIAVRDSEIEFIKDHYGESERMVLYVPGNHEFYHNDFDTRANQIKEILRHSNIYFLNTDWIEWEKPSSGQKVLFLGATLWTDLSHPFDNMIALTGMSDFNKNIVFNSHPDKWTERNKRDREYLKDILSNSENDTKKVVISHHLPLARSINERYEGDPLNCCYVSYCAELFNNDWSPDLWIHGHTHNSCDYVEGKTRVVCNPYGYDGSNGEIFDVNPEFKHDLLIEI